eukprot:gene38957-48107_t
MADLLRALKSLPQEGNMRKVSNTTRIISTFAGSSSGATGDFSNYVVRKVSFSTGIQTIIAGSLGITGQTGDGGQASSAKFEDVRSCWGDSVGNLYFTDYANKVIRKIVLSSGIITRIAGQYSVTSPVGDKGPALSGTLSGVMQIAGDKDGTILLADYAGNRVRVMYNSTNTLTPIATPTYVPSALPSVSFTPTVTPTTATPTTKYTLPSQIDTIAGSGYQGFSGNGGAATSAAMNWPVGVALDTMGNTYVSEANNHVAMEGKPQSTAVGDNVQATSTSIAPPFGIHVTTTGDVYASTQSIVRKVAGSDSIITTVVGTMANYATSTGTGDGGAATAATLSFPCQLWLDSSVLYMYFGDSGSNVVRRVTMSTGIIVTYVGTLESSGSSGYGDSATSALISGPRGLWGDSSGLSIYVASTLNMVILKVVISTGIMTRFAGVALSYGFSGDKGPALNAQLAAPTYITGDKDGTLLIGDRGNSRIRVVYNSTNTLAPIQYPTVSPTTSTPSLSLTPTVKPTTATPTVSIRPTTLYSLPLMTKIVAGVPGTLSYSGDGGQATSAAFNVIPGVALNKLGNGEIYVTDG